MKVQAYNQSAVHTTGEVRSSSLDSRVEAVKKSVIGQLDSYHTNAKTIEELKGKLARLGVTPDHPFSDCSIKLSKESGELGDLENKLFALEKDVKIQKFFIETMKEQLVVKIAGSNDPRVETVKQSIATELESYDTNAKTIKDLKGELARFGITPDHPFADCSIKLSKESGELGDLENKLFSLEKKVRTQQFFIETMKEQLVVKRAGSNDPRIETVEQSIATELDSYHTNAKTIEDLKGALARFGITPDYPCSDCSIKLSKESGELGSLENKLFSLEKDVRVQQFFIESMKEQLTVRVK